MKLLRMRLFFWVFTISGITFSFAEPHQVALSPSKAPNLIAYSPLELEIRKVVPGGYNKDEDNLADKGRPFGTNLRLFVRSVHYHYYFIHLNNQQSHISTFKDSKGSDLMRPLADDGYPAFDTKTSDDHFVMVLEAHAPRTPTKDATALTLKANLIMDCGVQEKTLELTNILSRNNQKIQVGPVNLSITVKNAAHQAGLKDVIFSFDKNSNYIKNITLYDSRGKQVEQLTVPANDQMSGVDDQTSVKPGAITAKIVYFNKSEPVPIHVNVHTTLGL